MKKSTFLGSVVSVLLTFSVISYARTYVRPQDPKPVQQTNQTVNTQSTNAAEAARPEAAATLVEPVNADSKNTAPEVLTRTVVLPGEIYSATAYSLRGRTASGKPVARGVIAADPRVLPIGTRVRVDAGAWSGEYVVADTGGAVRGRRIDIWTPTSGEAMRFGRRAVKLTVLEVGGRRARTASVRPRLVNSVNASPSTEAAASKQ
ncbi:MAG TPA: 3D domain-containing protein [Pyrinomonadaceae bacterium]|jgi:3D (Asp-Asp-Asp) domain-containing protein|nr:3D domain-containing protein [Pyrinomonadaceae bacterium]